MLKMPDRNGRVAGRVDYRRQIKWAEVPGRGLSDARRA